jgi:tRNA (uracil-5-)-methyltransferase
MQSKGKQEMRKARKKKQKHVPPEPYSNEDVLWRDIIDLLGSDTADKATEGGTDWESPFEYREEVTLVVSKIASSGQSRSSLHSSLEGANICSSLGEGLGVVPAPKLPWVIVVPFALPGETIKVRVHRSSRMHSFADLLSIEVMNTELRDPSRVKCKYFGSCAGCQYQVPTSS